jgi:hypothetical protein
LQLPFAPGFGKIGGAIIRSEIGQPNRSVLIPTPSLNARILASGGNPVFHGLSDAFQVVEPGFCLTLTPPENVMEDAGTAQVRLSIGAPAATDLLVTLRSSHPSVLEAPPTVMIPAGSMEADVEIKPVNNTLLEGVKLISLTAETANYSVAGANLKIIDDEKASLSIVAPTIFHEGDPGQIIIVNVSAAPATNIAVRYFSDFVGSYSSIAWLPAGSNQLTFRFGDDPYIQGNFTARFRVDYDNWIGASAEMEYIDNDPPTINLLLSEPIFEGGKTWGKITLGGPVVTNTPITLSSSRLDILGVPSTVIVPAFSSEAYFDYIALSNSHPPGPQSVKISASGPGLLETNATTTVTLYPPEPKLVVETAADRTSIRVHFSAEPGMAYFILSSVNPDGPWGSSAQIPVNAGLAEITLPIAAFGSVFFVVSQSAL